MRPINVPASGGGERINTGLRAADSDRPGGDEDARFFAPRGREVRGQTAEKRKARGETDAAHVVAGSRVAHHDLVRRKTAMLGHAIEIEREFRLVTDRYLDEARFGRRFGLAPSAEGRFDRLQAGLEFARRIKKHRHAGEGRCDVAHPREASCLEFMDRRENLA